MEVEKKDEQQEVELTPEQEAEAFAKGFDTVHKPEEYEEPTEALAPVEEPEERAEPEEPEEEPVLPEFGMTASQLKQKLASIDHLQQKYEQDISKVFGKFGEINRHLQQAGPGSLNKLSLKKLREEYPDVAELLESDLSESIGKPGPGFDPSELDQRFQTYSQTFEQKIRDLFEIRLLAFKHPDFNTLFDGENSRWLDLDAKEWLEKEADEETKRDFLSSRDAAWLSAKLDAFKDWKKKKYAAKETSTKRLERAVAPTTTNARAPGPSDYDEFVAGFKSARQQL